MLTTLQNHQLCKWSIFLYRLKNESPFLHHYAPVEVLNGIKLFEMFYQRAESLQS